MPRPGITDLLINVALDTQSGQPFCWQLFNQVRSGILSGQLKPGTRLPATRTLAREFSCSRTTVATAFDQLIAEGYLETRSGSGTFVADHVPDHFTTGDAPRAVAYELPARPFQLSAAGTLLADFGAARRRTLLTPPAPGLPSVETFPFELWNRLVRKAWAAPSSHLLRSVDPAGLPELRGAIATHMQAMRGLSCLADNVVVTSGSTQSFDFLSRILANPGDEVWVEEPGLEDLPPLLRANGLIPVPVPVDAEGLIVEAGVRLAPRARLAIVTPSHQYPTGAVMSLSRRLQLLEWARASDTWVLEDDYDMEFRYSGRMQSALQSLDNAGRVLYLGTFSKITFPNIRLGYVIAEATLADRIAAARQTLDFHSSYFLQPVMAAFLRDGHFAAHVRRVRRVCEKRQQTLLRAAAQHLSGMLECRADEAGLHLVVTFTPAFAARTSDTAAAAALDAAGVATRPLSTFFVGSARMQGFILNYSGIPESEITEVVKTMGRVLAAL